MEPGDVALLLKSDGSTEVLTFGYDTSRLEQPDYLLTEMDRFMMKQGEIIFALAVAANSPKIMDQLIAWAADPEVVDFATLHAMQKRH